MPGFMFAKSRLRLMTFCLGATAMACTLASCAPEAKDEAAANAGHADWAANGGDPGRSQYSPLSQINLQNVQKLRPAWVFNAGEFTGSPWEANPLVIDGVIYTTTPKLKVVALDGATGKRLWQFDPYGGAEAGQTLNRGVSYWRKGSEARILFTAGPHLYALDAKAGRQIQTFGKQGRVDLREGLGIDPESAYVDATSPGAIYDDLIAIGTRVGEGVISAPGHIRAYDVRTGAMRWIFHTIPHPGEQGHDTWPKEAWRWAGGANAWGGISVDTKRGIFFAGTGTSTYDYWGGNRHGDNLFANTVLALDARTGERVWHYQTIRHDVWDRDLATPPTLVTIERDGRKIDAAVQTTKQGVLYVFDRVTGRPLFPVGERRLPPSDVPGESLAKTQPIPMKPAPLARQDFTEADVNDITPEIRQAILADIRKNKYRLGAAFTPPSIEGTVTTPGLAGANGWGGAAFDPATSLLYVNSSEVPILLKLLPVKEGIVSRGRATYLENCAACHGADMKGNGHEVPSLVGVGGRMGRRELGTLIMKGRGRMPGFPNLSFEQVTNLMDILYGGSGAVAGNGKSAHPLVPYVLTGMNDFLGPDGYPAIKPPWGTLNAVDLKTGDIVWKVPLGEYPELKAKGVPPTGTKNFGGPIVTAGGLVFIGATMDEKFRAFDARTGKVVWQTDLPGSAFATPSTYMIGGKQYVLIAAGGGQNRKAADALIAFALP